MCVGRIACVYTKEHSTTGGQTNWKRHILDVYGTPNQRLKTGDGPGHFIVCADFDGDGDDEFLLSLFGPLDRDENEDALPPQPGPHPYKGIMYYKPIDLKRGIFAKWRVADESSARIAIGDFAGTGRYDLISISYNVACYYEEPNPVVTLHLNDFAPVKEQPTSSPAIFSTLWDNEGMVYLLNPSIKQNNVTGPSIANLIKIAGYAISVEVYPPAHEIPVGSGDGLKVLYGSIVLLDSNGKVADTRQPFSVPEFSAATTATYSKMGISDQKLGAVLLRLRPAEDASDEYCAAGFSSAEDVPVSTVLSLPAPYYKLAPLKFNKVDSLWWGAPFKGIDFFNLSGFHFQFITDSGTTAHSPLAHIQFWTAGKDVNCGVHNHAGNIFCEVHISLSAGTGDGGMARLKPEYEQCPQDKYNDLGPEAFDHLPLKELEEHGGIWERGSNGKPVRANPAGVVKYPWHKWQAGNEADNVDVWMAIEFHPDVVDQAVDDGQKAEEIEHLGGRAIRRGRSLAMITEKDGWDNLGDVVMLV